MQNKSWNEKLKSLLHSLDVDTNSRIDEISKFGKTPSDVRSKIKSIHAKYKKDPGIKNEKPDDLFDEYSEFDESDPEFSRMLKRFFDEMHTGDPMTDAVLMWFQELVILNEGKFKIIKNDDNSISIIFNTDEYTEDGKKISITSELLNTVDKINNNEITYKKLDPEKKPSPAKKITNRATIRKKPVAKKAVVKKATEKKPLEQKNEKRTKRQPETKKNPKNKDTE